MCFTIDLTLTQVVDGDLVKVFAWYDNEWGYTSQLIREAVGVTKTLVDAGPGMALTADDVQRFYCCYRMDT